MKVLVALVLLLALASARRSESDYLAEWKSFTTKYDKSYNHDEAYYRYKNFKNNVDYIDYFNKNLRQQRTFSVGINKFSDLSNEEYRKFYLGTTLDATKYVRTGQPFVPSVNSKDLPDSMNWTAQGAVTPVKNQEQCGSCWAFSTTGSTEGCHFLTTGNLVPLSEQNLVDCSGSYGNMGCQGGLMDQAFEYIIANNGIDTETTYVYTAQNGNCHYEAGVSCGSTVTSYTDVTSGSEPDLQQAVFGAPVSIAIDAGLSSFQNYESGVYYDPECSSTQLDHGVLAVGWGTDAGSDYWIVKNSWGNDWGQIGGYIWMARNRNNACGVATMASFPSKCGNCASA